MSANTTNSSKSGMDCDKAAREEIFERYLAGTLSDEDRDAFEEHYFGCARCFEELQTLQAIRDELPRRSLIPSATRHAALRGWAPAPAWPRLVLTVGAVLWMRRRRHWRPPKRRNPSRRHGRQPAEPPASNRNRRLRRGLRSNSSHDLNPLATSR